MAGVAEVFKTDQLWSEIACYEPGQSTAMHHHPKEEEAIFVLQGTAMSVAGEEYVLPPTWTTTCAISRRTAA